MGYYLALTEAQVVKMQGSRKSVNRFNAVKTKGGQWVCDINSMYEFEEFFDDETVTLLDLSASDFPPEAG